MILVIVRPSRVCLQFYLLMSVSTSLFVFLKKMYMKTTRFHSNLQLTRVRTVVLDNRYKSIGVHQHAPS
jgi:hypothetical protein